MLNSLSKEQVQKNMSTSLGIYTGNYNVFNSLNRLAQFMNMNGLPKSSVKFTFDKLVDGKYIVVPFSEKFEFNNDPIGVYTIKKFEKYAYEVIE